MENRDFCLVSDYTFVVNIWETMYFLDQLWYLNQWLGDLLHVPLIEMFLLASRSIFYEAVNKQNTERCIQPGRAYSPTIKQEMDLGLGRRKRFWSTLDVLWISTRMLWTWGLGLHKIQRNPLPCFLSWSIIFRPWHGIWTVFFPFISDCATSARCLG